MKEDKGNPMSRIKLYNTQLSTVLEADKKYPSLHLAVINRERKKVRALLRRKVDIEASNTYGLTALHLAASMSDVQTAELLLNHGAQPVPECCAKFPPIMFAVVAKCKEMIDLFLKFGCDINELVDQKFSYVHYYVEHGDVEMLKFIVERGADLNILDCDGSLPISLAIKNDALEIIEFLLDNGASVTKKPFMSEWPLLEGLKKQDEKMFQMLAFYADHFKDSDKNGLKILHIATKLSMHNFMLILLEENANPSVKCELMLTPLHYAIINRDEKAIEILCQFNANISVGKIPYYLRKPIHSMLTDHSNTHLLYIEDTNSSFTPLDFAISSEKQYIDLLLSLELEQSIESGCFEAHFKNYYSRNRHYFQFFLKTRAAGLLTSDKICRIAEQTKDESRYVKCCKAEMIRMKTTKLNNKITFYDFLTGSRRQLRNYVQIEDVINTFSTEKYGHQFPIYKYILKWRYFVGLRSYKILTESYENINKIFKLQVPFLISKHVISYLNEHQLNVLKLAVCPPEIRNK